MTNPTNPVASQQKPQAPSRMNMSALVKGRQEKPIRVLLFGVEGVGKSTFAASAPAPVFVGAEDGTAHLDVTRFPMPGTHQEVMDCVRLLTSEPHQFGTIVIDTLDWMEPLVWDFICRRDGKKNIEEYGYGRGYQAALDEWRVFLAALDRLRDKRQMNVILLAHSWIKPFKNPEGPDYDRYELKLHSKAGGLLKEWCDAVLFANYQSFAVVDEKTKRAKGVGTSARLIYSTRSVAFDAKNRFDLPESLPLDWAEFHAAVKAHRPADPAELVKAIREKAERLDAEGKAKAMEYLAAAGADAVKLAKLNTWINAKEAA